MLAAEPLRRRKIYIRGQLINYVTRRDLVRGEETDATRRGSARLGVRSLLTKRFDGCLMHNKGLLPSQPRFISRRIDRSAK